MIESLRGVFCACVSWGVWRMVFEQIEKLKRDWTDKYVVADVSRPELARFHNMTGIVKTVNMNGRALVEFDGNANIGWYDIALDFLKQVDGPQPKVDKARAAAPAEPKAAPAKPAAASGEKKSSTADVLAAARGKAPAAPAGDAPKKMSTSDILAAARANAAGGAATAAKPAAPKPAAAAAKPAAKPTGKLSTADILAAARAQKAGGAAPVEEAPAEAVDESPVAAVEPTVAAPAPKAKPAAGGPLPKTTADIIAYCRRVDAQG